ncbi:hypothetical protein DSCW_32070 [Desulfosarcina widdelii]|uniref:Uncharacterized protein n=1 Tax=Desulfosarcina widdelii TaxID=947919 RepID=A0A5K7Z512_9BACT|nr:hypothetical protein [Desulfosarcina widdelii]BBO75790.1 hypothetical protein DSCW_32070 [Desulfosarcina widdelii]
MKNNLFIQFAIFVVLFFQFIAVKPAASDTNCVRSLISPGENPLRYKERGGRCEGLYEKPKKGSLYLVSFCQPADSTLHERPESLPLKWSNQNSDPVHLSGYVLNYPYSDSYQMDKIMDKNPGKYNWPLGFIYALNIEAKEIGIVCRTILAKGNTEKEIYYPIKISSTVPNTYKLVFKSDYYLYDITYSLASVDQQSGFPIHYFHQSKPVAKFKGPDELIIINIEGGMQTGYYQFQINAFYGSDHLPTGEIIWFFHD